MVTSETNIDHQSFDGHSYSRVYSQSTDLKDECTATCFGLDTIAQECYYCINCDPKHLIKLCTNCFDKCHEECQNYINDFNKSDYFLGIRSFSCDCFTKLKHQPNETQRKEQYTCDMKILDKVLSQNKFFYCEDDHLLVCSLCYFNCHCNCNNKRILKSKEIQSNSNQININVCQCRHINHSSFNEFLFKGQIEGFCSIMNISLWPIQYINLTFSVDSIFSRFVSVFKQNAFTNSEFREMVKSCLPLVEDLSIVFNRKFKEFYFSEKIRKIFSFDTITKIMKKCSIYDYCQIKFKLKLLHIFHYVHCKKDFLAINKPLSSGDFLTGSIIQRLKYRYKTRKFFSNIKKNDENDIEQFGDFYLSKYGNNHENIINLLFTDLLPFTINLVQTPNFNIFEFEEDLTYFLQFVCFLVKRNIFTLPTLRKLIDNLYLIHGRLIFIGNFKSEQFLTSWKKLFNYFIEIFYLLSVTFNDLIIEEYLQGEKAKAPEGLFIHADPKQGQKLLRMIMKSNNLICKHYKNKGTNIKDNSNFLIENNIELGRERDRRKTKKINLNMIFPKVPKKGLLTEKTLQFYHQSVNMFALSNNLYSSTLKKITQKNIDDYLIYIGHKKMENRENNEEEEQKEDGSEMERGFNFKELKESIENKFNFLFLNYSSSEQTKLIANSIKMAITNFISANSKDEGNMQSYLNSSNSIMGIFEEEKKESTLGLEEEKFQLYAQKVIDFNKYTSLQFIKTIYKNIDTISQKMIDSNIDYILSNSLIIFSDPRTKILTFDFIELLLSFISIFFLSKQTMTYFLMGKNLLYLNKLFHRYCMTSTNLVKYNIKYLQTIRFLLEFYQLLLQGAIIYEIDLSNTKILPRLWKNIIKYHLNEFFILQTNDYNLHSEFKLQLNITMRIFYMISGYYNYDDFTMIKERLLDIFNNIMNSDNFYKFYGREVKGMNRNFRIFPRKNSHFFNSEKNLNRLVGNKLGNLKKDSIKTTPVDEKSDIELIFSFFEIFSKQTYVISEEKFATLENVNAFFMYKKNDIIDDQVDTNIINEEDNSENSCQSSEPKPNTKKEKGKNKNKEGEAKSKNSYPSNGINELMDEDSMILFLFENDNFEINEKLTILCFLRTVCFIQQTKYQNVKDIKNAMNTEDYMEFISSNIKMKNPYPNVTLIQRKKKKPLNELEMQYTKIQRIILLIKLYTNELKRINTLVTNLFDIEQYIKRKYLSELIFGVRLLADFFFLEKDIWNKPIMNFYILAIEFIKSANTIIQIFNNDKEEHINKKTTNDIIFELSSKRFDIFDIDTIYKHLSETIGRIFAITNMNHKTSLITFLEIYDKLQENNFIPDSLIEDKDYEYFYEDIGGKHSQENFAVADNNIIFEFYTSQFTEVHKTALLLVIKGISNDIEKINYRKKFVDYFRFYLNEQSQSEVFQSLMCIITKIFFYDTDYLKELLVNLIVKTFFSNFQKVLKKNIFETFITSKNYYITKRCLNVMSLSKLILQFLQLMGEGFSTDFQELIFLNNHNTNEPAIFQEIITTLRNSFVLIDYKSEIDAELPYDKLIILITNLIDFIIEYLVTKKEYTPIVDKSIDILLFQNPKMVDIITTRLENLTNPFSNRLKILLYIKVKVIQLLKAYLQSGKKTLTLKKLSQNQFSTIEIFQEIIYTFRALLKHVEITNPKSYYKLMNTKSVDKFVSILLELYSKDHNFRDTLELKLCFNLYILIKSIEEKYNHMEIEENFSKDADKDKFIKDENDWSIRSLNAYKIYCFLNELVVSIEVEVKVISNGEQEEEIVIFNQGDDSSDNISNKEKNENEQEVKDKKEVNTVTKSQSVFFVRPYLTFFISEQSRRNFIYGVDRENAIGKYSGLMLESDYFLFEMVVNKKFIMSTALNKFFCDFNFYIFEWINFILIIIQNIILVMSTFNSPYNPKEKYNTSNAEDFNSFTIPHLTVSIIQIVFIVIVLIIWVRYKLTLCYQRNMMMLNNKCFVFRQKKDFGRKKVTNELVDFFQNDEHKIWDTVIQANCDISLGRKIEILLIHSILLNREVCIYVYTLIFVVLYLSLKVELLLIVPTFLVCNISTYLFAVFSALIDRWYSMSLVMLYTYLITYVFSWFAFYFLYKNFMFYSVMDPLTNESIPEHFCSSSIQCWLYNIDYGVRPQFGGGDNLGKISFRDDPGFYVMRWVYDTLFYIIVVLFMRNLFLGIITEAFGELRNKNYMIENDMKNICFICQLTRDQSLYKSIDFKEHTEKKHNMWNYVYFLIHLHLGNTNDLDQIQKNVWDKIGNQDYSWIPQVDNDD